MLQLYSLLLSQKPHKAKGFPVAGKVDLTMLAEENRKDDHNFDRPTLTILYRWSRESFKEGP